MKLIITLVLFTFIALHGAALFAGSSPSNWKREWPRTDFDKTSVNFSEILSGGPPKDGIPAIDNPEFITVSKVSDLGAQEPVITLRINGEAKAYPLEKRHGFWMI